MKINYVYMLSLFMIWGCEGFLDERPDKSILIPTTVEDIRALLDNDSDLNVVPGFGLLSSDDLWITDDGWTALSTPAEQNAYIWEKDIWAGAESADWSRMYHQIFIANVALDQLGLLPQSQEVDYLMGEALFHRAHAHFMLAQVFSPVYHAENAASTFGIPLRLNSEILERSPRVELNVFYKAILQDLEVAYSVLPETQSLKTRPSRLSAKALEARVHLVMGDYKSAGNAANLVMENSAYSLMDYNSQDSTARYPFAKYNSEVVFHSVILSYSFSGVGNVNVWIHPDIYESYGMWDLRRVLYGQGRSNAGFSFKGQYTGNFGRFGGIALDELYFIKMECLARTGQSAAALDLLNDFLETRFVTGKFIPFNINGIQELLEVILEEKRKSLVYRGVNWIDLRRLNQEEEFKRVIAREWMGEEVKLNYGSKKYVLPIPQGELNLNPIPQTDRED
ncbi:RagB/SusD family nutrient uptake outer membrane protein [uncultured Algoriphagus sp.]|uniref:RagB/SusD family nutrient uptake outer membrane protein n=1 Tax=uncultured Algoriphagus sp. TaxID=417365 RepID=UPI0030ED1700|tara:strand:+ start:4817 stop:6169 length:1353 start_codon:yes stop_codon:yes gene_type:complete